MSKIRHSADTHPPVIAGVVYLLLGTGAAAFALQSVLQDHILSEALVGSSIADRLVDWLGGERRVGVDGGPLENVVGLGPVFLLLSACSLATWVLGGAWLAHRREARRADALAAWGCSGWVWWLLPGLWELSRVAALLMQFESLALLLFNTSWLWFAVAATGWGVAYLTLLDRATTRDDSEPSLQESRYSLPLSVCLAMLSYVLVFTAMNWQLYFSLNLPHGDSAMYEEHLWNLTHGKGFRSYLDQGLFLGEHMQVIHLLLVPLHLIWPSQLLLELCESLALASGALPVYWMARRHSDSKTVGTLFAIAYLLYVPMHFLDIAVDLKTFRPTCFGATALLFALDQWERGRWKTTLALLLLTLSAKEDYAAVIAPFGVWLAMTAGERKSRWFGAAVAAGTIVYLALAITVFIPAFRAGGDVHYARYFGELGNSPGDIVRSLFERPALVLAKLFSVRSAIYVSVLLVPLGFLPLLSPGRLLVAVPWFAVLCLLELSADPASRGQMLVPLHHFHAPLVPVLLWAACAGIDRVKVFAQGRRDRQDDSAERAALWAARFACGCALTTGFCLGFSPLSRQFWDPASHAHWQRRYVPGQRAEMFARIEGLIPRDARVASTDFVHPRFTHHERSYDYSDYPRAVNDNKPGAPPDTDYIVIDTQHPYSRIKTPEQIPEYAEHPDRWEVLPDRTDGYFIVLRRKGQQP